MPEQTIDNAERDPRPAMTIPEQAVEAAVELLGRHVECVRYYLHMQIGKPKPNLQSAPEITLDTLKSEVVAAIRGIIGPSLVGVQRPERETIALKVQNILSETLDAADGAEIIGTGKASYQIADAVLATIPNGAGVQRPEDVARAIDAIAREITEEVIIEMAAEDRIRSAGDSIAPGSDLHTIKSLLAEIHQLREALAESALPHTGQRQEGTDEGTHVTVGLGLCDIGPIKAEGRTGVLVRPRGEHIPFGEPGELQNTEYWPRKGDVVIWVEGDGPGVLIKELAALSAAPASPRAEGEANTRYNAGVISALMNELIGSVERRRLQKTPWARSLVNDLVRRIANLRAIIAEKQTGAK
jgi:hypothetical protein